MCASLLGFVSQGGQTLKHHAAGAARSPDLGQIFNPLVPHPLAVVHLLLFLHDGSDGVLGVRVGHHHKGPGLGVCATRSGAW